MRISLKIEFKKISARLHKELVEMRASHKAGIRIVKLARRNVVITNEIRREKMRRRGYHILIEISVLLAAVACFRWETVLDVADRLFGKPIFRDLDCTRNSRLEFLCGFKIALARVSSCFVFINYRKHRLVVNELIASAAESHFARQRLHFQRHQRSFTENLVYPRKMLALIAEIEKKSEEISRNKIVHYRLIVDVLQIVHIHPVFIKSVELIFNLHFNEILVVATEKLCPCKFAYSSKKRPVADHVIGVQSKLVITFRDNDGRKISLPALDIARKHSLLLKLKYAKYDLSDGKIVRRLDFRDLLTAKVHHFNEKRNQINSVAVADKNADVYRKARKTVLG